MNALEVALNRAASEPASRPEFLRLLLESTVYALGISDPPMEGSGTLEAGARIQLKHWGKPDGTSVIPFFASPEALQRAIEGEEKYLAMSGRHLFELTEGATLILNPRSPIAKEFTPREVRKLLKN